MINGINAYQNYELKTKGSEKRKKTFDISSVATPKKRKKDLYTPTSPKGIRNDLVNSVKEKVKKGYYNSEEVIDDLSASFANAFNTALK